MIDLRAPDVYEEIKAPSPLKYAELEPDFKDKLKNSKIETLLSELIALEVSKYILYHTSGGPFDQHVSDTIGSIHSQKRAELEEIIGKEYVCHNDDW